MRASKYTDHQIRRMQIYLDSIPQEIPEIDDTIVKLAKGAIDRFGWCRYEARGEALRQARISRGVYVCFVCEDLFGPRDVQVDHHAARIEPEEGWQGFDEYVKRTFVPVALLHVLCKSCHSLKSSVENKIRREQNGPTEVTDNVGRKRKGTKASTD